MAKPLDDLVALLRLERLEENRFRGESRDPGWGTVFGGQVLGQALSAAIETVAADRRVHSLHAYFLRPGDVARPIVYEVERIRDGRSFTTRRVVANQGGPAIFAMSCSFQIDEPGVEHQVAMPPAPAPETLPTEQQRLAPFLTAAPEAVRAQLLAERPFEVRTADQIGDDPFAPARGEPRRLTWIRAIDALPEQPALHACLLAYVSDYQFGTTALAPHGMSWLSPSRAARFDRPRDVVSPPVSLRRLAAPRHGEPDCPGGARSGPRVGLHPRWTSRRFDGTRRVDPLSRLR